MTLVSCLVLPQTDCVVKRIDECPGWEPAKVQFWDILVIVDERLEVFMIFLTLDFSDNFQYRNLRKWKILAALDSKIAPIWLEFSFKGPENESLFSFFDKNKNQNEFWTRP
jgi:hypothetical protein